MNSTASGEHMGSVIGCRWGNRDAPVDAGTGKDDIVTANKKEGVFFFRQR